MTSILRSEKWKKVTFFGFFCKNMKSRDLAKFCVDINVYHFFQVFFKFFSFYAEWCQKVILKIKNKKSQYFLHKTRIFSQTSILSSKNEKKLLFSIFFQKHEKSSFAYILRKNWCVSFFLSFSDFFFYFKQNNVRKRF